MNLKKIIDYGHTLRDHEENASDPKHNVSTGIKLYQSEKDFKEILRSFEIHPYDVTTSGLIEVREDPSCTTPNLYLTEYTAEMRTSGKQGRLRLLRIPPVQATAEFALLGASVRFRTYDIFVEFDPKNGDYMLCLPAGQGQDIDAIKDPAKAGSGVAHCILQGKWRA